jgi:hypothetical protein
MDDEFDEPVEDEDVVDITDEDFAQLAVFGEDPTWEIPLLRRIPDPSRKGGVRVYRLWVPVKMLTQAELLRMQEGQRIPKGSRNILDATAIKRWSRAEVEMLNAAVKKAGGKIRFVLAPRGKANYAAGEISIEDLTRDDLRRLEAAISPGISKSEEDIEDEVRASRRQAGAPSKKPQRVPLDSGGALEDSSPSAADV